MSIHAPEPQQRKPGGSLVNFLILFPFTLALLGCAPPLGRKALSWFSAGLALLVFLGTVKNCFLVKS